MNLRSEVIADKVGNLFDAPERKLRKYLQGGKIEQSDDTHPIPLPRTVLRPRDGAGIQPILVLLA